MAEKDSKLTLVTAPAQTTTILFASADGITIRWTSRSIAHGERDAFSDQG